MSKSFSIFFKEGNQLRAKEPNIKVKKFSEIVRKLTKLICVRAVSPKPQKY